MIIANQKPIRIIGYPQSSMHQEFVNEITRTHAAETITPEDFLLAPSSDYQYIVSISFDFQERKKIIQYIDQINLDMITVIHDSVILGTNPPALIGPGSFIFPFTCLSLGAQIGRHCVIGPYNLIGHYSTLGNNCLTRPGVTISDKSHVGNHCILNIKATVTNKVNITDDVEVQGLSNVTKDITQPGQYVGYRARRFNPLQTQ